MVRAYHAIFTAYGFWLPNDPRGSWTDFIASWEILRYGPPIPANSRTSLANKAHNTHHRLAAKRALKRPPVIFTGIQAREISRGFQTAIDASRYTLLACAIMPDHIHIVSRRHTHTIERVVGHLKSRASQQLANQNLHPFQHIPADPLHSPWAENCWKVFLNTDHEIRRAITYVNQNPMRENHRPQSWSFITPFPTPNAPPV